MAERTQGWVEFPAFFCKLLPCSVSPYINRFLQPDTIIPNAANPQSWNRYSYVQNRPVDFDDPTGHKLDEGCGTGGTSCNPPPPGDPPASNPPGGGGDNNCNNDPNCDLSADEPDSKPDELTGILCSEQVLSQSTCEQINGLAGVTVLTLDGISFIGSSIFAILTVVALLGGPFGLSVVAGAYEIANLAEGWAGAASFVVTLANDILITGGTYITLGSNPELVASSDVVISLIFAGAGGADPEPFGDTLINGAATAYDAYRLTGGKTLFSLHLAPFRWYLTE